MARPSPLTMLWTSEAWQFSSKPGRRLDSTNSLGRWALTKFSVRRAPIGLTVSHRILSCSQYMLRPPFFGELAFTLEKHAPSRWAFGRSPGHCFWSARKSMSSCSFLQSRPFRLSPPCEMLMLSATCSPASTQCGVKSVFHSTSFGSIK